MLNKLIDGVPIYVPHNRLIIVSDCSTDTLEVDLNTKMTKLVSKKQINNNHFSVYYKLG